MSSARSTASKAVRLHAAIRRPLAEALSHAPPSRSTGQRSAPASAACYARGRCREGAGFDGGVPSGLGPAGGPFPPPAAVPRAPAWWTLCRAAARRAAAGRGRLSASAGSMVSEGLCCYVSGGMTIEFGAARVRAQRASAMQRGPVLEVCSCRCVCVCVCVTGEARLCVSAEHASSMTSSHERAAECATRRVAGQRVA